MHALPLPFEREPDSAPASPSREPRRARALAIEWAPLAAATALGLALRASFVLPADFPLGDGGLFLTMVEAVREHGYALPREVAYNGLAIPFAYPPLGFYAGALWADLGGAGAIGALRWVPLLASAATVAAFALLARDLLHSRLAQVVATFAYALLPGAYVWMILGGGLTRSFGLLFALLAVRAVLRAFTRPQRRYVALAAWWSALAVLSHLEAALLVAHSAGLFWLLFGRSRATLWRALAIGAGVLALTAPWSALVVARHGLEPLRAAADTGGEPLVGVAALLLSLGSSGAAPVVWPLALLGVLACWVDRKLFAPLWLVAIFALNLRSADNYGAAPIALLAGIGTADVLLPALQPARLHASAHAFGRRLPRLAVAVPGRFQAGVLVLLLLFALGASVQLGALRAQALTPQQRDALVAVSTTTPPDARVLALATTGDGARRWGWTRDALGEWFPVLAQRRAVVTPQGQEWLGTHGRAVAAYRDVHRCVHQDIACVETQAARHGVTFDHVLLPRLPSDAAASALGTRPPICCPELEAALASDPRYERVFDLAGGTLFRRREAFAP
jgi:hypothetical protein